jgi:hypothetical protein
MNLKTSTIWLFVFVTSFLSACVKEDVDETIIILPGDNDPETTFVYDCELLELNFSDSCLTEVNGFVTGGIVNDSCDCLVNTPCDVAATILSEDDNGTGVGSLTAFGYGGTLDYTYFWFLDGVMIGYFEEIQGLFSDNYQLIIQDTNGCSMSYMAIVGEDLSSWDCPELIGDVGDQCEEGLGAIDVNCNCILNLDCNISLQLLETTPDNGFGNGTYQFFIGGGQAPYEWVLFDSDYSQVQDGSLDLNSTIFTIQDISAGFYIVEFIDDAGCLSSVMFVIQ